VSVTLTVVVSLVPAVLLVGAMALGACRASSEADRNREAALVRVRAQRQRYRTYQDY
jgi:hypothetical protein